MGWEKGRRHARKHGVTFDTASLAFFDDWAIDDFDAAHSDEIEKRFILIGLAGTTLIRVVYTMRDNVRIISAEKARPFEVDAYNNNRNEYDR